MRETKPFLVWNPQAEVSAVEKNSEFQDILSMELAVFSVLQDAGKVGMLKKALSTRGLLLFRVGIISDLLSVLLRSL